MAKEFIFEQFLAESRAIDRGEFLIVALLFLCESICANTSLPVPVSPVNSTVESVTATFLPIQQPL